MKPFRSSPTRSTRPARSELGERARAAEDLGVTTFVLPDHLVPQLAPVPYLATVAALTERSGSARSSTTTTCAIRRSSPRTSPRSTSCPSGRLDVAIGAGWNEPEYGAIGLPFDPVRVRQARLAEAITVLKGCFGEGPFSFAGEHYTITDYDAYPKPVQRPHPPLFIGGGGRKTLELAAREADVVGLAPRILSRAARPTPRRSPGRRPRRRSAGSARPPATGSTSSTFNVYPSQWPIVVTDDLHGEAAQGHRPDEGADRARS